MDTFLDSYKAYPRRQKHGVNLVISSEIKTVI